MANKVMVGSGDEVSKLAAVITQVQNKTRHFKSQLSQIQKTLTRINPGYKESEKQNHDLGKGKMHETEIFIGQLKEAEELVRKCEQIKWNTVKRVHQMYKLYNLNKSLLRYFKYYLTLQTRVNTKEAKLERGSWPCHVPVLRDMVIGFDEQVMDLKRMLLKDSSRGGVDDCHVVVISGGAGCGKTTLATMLCHDPEIKGIYGNFIFFATISKNPNMKLVIRNILPNNRAGQVNFVSDEDAIQHWGIFLNNYRKSDTLLILDDVWSDTVIYDLQFMSRGYKILVTSETTFKGFVTYQMRPLSDQDAINLLCYSALSKHASQATSDDIDDDDIPENLVDKLAKCCKKNPLALRIVGGCLEGTQVESWHHTLKKLSQATHPDLIDLSLDEANRFHLARALGLLKDEERNSPRTSTSKKFTRSYQIT